MSQNDSSVPVVVVGGTLNGLGVARSLSSGRAPIYVLDSSRQCAAAWSRHCTFVHTPSLEGEGLVGKLTRLALDLGCRPVLLLTADQSVITVSDCQSRLDPYYYINLPPAETVAALADKAAFHRLAERAGFPIPRGVPINGEDDLDRIDELTPPLIIKPADKRLVLAGVVDRVVRAPTVADARTIAAQMLARASSLIVQEWVRGADSEIFFTLFSCDRYSNLVGSFAGRKLACSPPAIGNTAVCVAAPEVSKELQTLTLNFVEHVRYSGLGSLEFKRDVRTRRFLIIEPTVGRTDMQEEIATLCGVNLPLLAYHAALGLPAPAVCKDTGVSVAWRFSYGFRIPRKELGLGVRMTDGFFRWNDPFPALYHYGYERLAKRAWARATKSVCAMSRRTTRFL